jgi:YHS domain-containing protein
MKMIATCMVCALALAACGGAPPAPATPAAPTATQATPAAAAAPSGPVKPIGEAQIGDTSNCPVSGEEFVVTADSPKAEHDGKTYYFCCSGCAKKFAADPAKYLTKKN